MNIKILGPTHAESYHKIRLEGLRNHPEAFGSSYEEEKGFSIERFESRLNDEHSFTFGAFDGEKLAGVVTLVLETKVKLKHRAGIYAMYVSTYRQRSGIGKSLMQEAINKAKEMGYIEQIYLAVVSSNKAAKKMYESLGFVIYGVDKKALKIGQDYYDEELMVLYI